MDVDELARNVVRFLAQYLIHRQQAGAHAFDAQAENLAGHVDALLVADPFLDEMLRRFKDSPGNVALGETLRLNLAEKLRAEPGSAAALAEELKRVPDTGSVAVPGARRRNGPALLVGGLVLVVVIGLVVWFASPGEPGTPPAAVTTIVTTTTTTLTTTATSSSAAPSSLPSVSLPASAQPGDGGSVTAGTRIFVDGLPRPHDDWTFYHGDHDVQLEQRNNSMWGSLNSCSSDGRSRKQEFRLKNFKRLEVPAIGTDSQSDIGLSVKFQVFVNDEQVQPHHEVVVGPGKTEKIGLDLPKGVFAITLQVSLLTADTKKCARGNAVWGSPYVVAGSN